MPAIDTTFLPGIAVPLEGARAAPLAGVGADAGPASTALTALPPVAGHGVPAAAITGLRVPSSPGDISVLLAETFAALEESIGDARAMGDSMLLNGLLQALHSATPQAAAAEVIQDDKAEKTEVDALLASIIAGRAAAGGDPAAMVALARASLTAAAGIFSAEALRLDGTARGEAAAAQAFDLQGALAVLDAATPAEQAGLAAGIVSTLESLLEQKSGALQSGIETGSQSLTAASIALNATVARVSAQIASQQSARNLDASQRGLLVDDLLSTLMQAAARGDRPASLAARPADSRLAEDDPEGLRRIAESILAAAADLAATLATLDPLAMPVPAVQPGRSRVRLEI